MNIRIGDFLLTSDPMNITLSEVKVRDKGDKAGEEYTSVVGYFASVTHALEGLLSRKVKASEATSIKELLNDYYAISRLINEALRGL